MTATTTFADPADEEPPKKNNRGGRSKALSHAHPNSPTSPESIAARKREAEAIELRAAGLTFADIAKEMGLYDESAAHKIVMRGLGRITQEPAEELRRLECERLDRMFRSMYVKAVAGSWLAVDRCLTIMKRRAELLGLDAPIRIKQETISEEDLNAAIQHLVEQAEALEEAQKALDAEADIVDAEVVDADEG